MLTSTVEDLPDDVEAVSAWLHERGHTDGLPVVPPTRERVLRMLEGTTRDPATDLGAVPPTNGAATVEKLAINAVMAGCRPEYLPVVLTAFDLLLQPGFQLAGMQPTTNPLTPMLIVNGPVRHRVGLNCSTGVMGPGWQANATIGRAVRLALINLGGARPGEVDKCTQGFVGKYTLCVGENEEDSPWAPLSADRGFERGQDVLTVVGVNSAINIHDSSGDWNDVVKTFCGSLPSVGTPNVVDPHATPVLALNPLHARILTDGGFDKAALREHLVANTTLPADALSERRAHLRREEGEEDYLVDGRIPIVNDADSLQLVVTGGMGGGHSCFLPAGHYGQAQSAIVDI
ncbi:MAG TPA: hypothetical protein VH969_00140 [Actinophytocola sp.]|jgi:hypothetical protein|uniref:hypothetical protein n=1 Tax=Actinophytocola sp. TaxID=1872138 RepID=UPI002F9370E2